MSKIITLQNGTRLKCFEKAGCEDAKSIDNSMQIDLTGVYFQLGREKHRKKKKHIRLEDRPEVQLFLMNAHYLFEHSNDILNDSRMFLCPVPFENILLCFGVSGFRHPTLGGTSSGGSVARMSDCWTSKGGSGWYINWLAPR